MALTRIAATALLLSGLLLQPALAQKKNTGAKFIYPSKDGDKPKFYDNTEVIVAYKCPGETVALRIYCKDEEKEDYVHQAAIFDDVKCADGEYSFRVDFDYYAEKCWFNMRDLDGSVDVGLNSPNFELSRTEADATFGLDQPTAAITTGSSKPSSTGDSNQGTSTADSNSSGSTEAASDNDPNSDSGLSSGAKIGIGVGVSLGVLGVAALAGAFWLVRRKKRGGAGAGAAPPSDKHELHSEASQRQELNGDMATGYHNKPPGYQGQDYYGGDGVKSVNEGSASELADTRRTYELP